MGGDGRGRWHVREVDHTTTRQRVAHRIAVNDPDWVLVASPATVDAQHQLDGLDGLQAADHFAGMLSAVIRRDETTC